MLLGRRTSFGLFLVGIALFWVPWDQDVPFVSLGSVGKGSSKDRNLHLLIPVTSAKPNFCRTALTAALLDYPTPILVNWHGKEDRRNHFASHLAKIDSTLKYLRGLPARNDKDLVLIVDGYDVWFQLRPEVLIARYHSVIADSNERLTKSFTSDLLQENNIKQTVLFGADKKCWPQAARSRTCTIVPESTLPDDVYGSRTDKPGDHSHARPRWLNSGTILGPVADVRRIFEAASERVRTHFHGYSDQWYFAEILGQQESWRSSLVSSTHGIAEKNTSDSKLNTRRSAELHMVLDYQAALFHTNAFAAGDSGWIVFNDTAPFGGEVMDGSNRQEESPSRLPSDVEASRPPIFQGLVTEELFDEEPSFAELPFDTTWGDVSLLYNRISGQIPAVVHMNGDKKLLNAWWGKLWWASDGWGKHLLRSSSRATRGPLATSFDIQTSQVTHWWKGSYNSLRRENGGYWTSAGRWLFFNDICSQYSDVLFEGKPVKLEKLRGGYLGSPIKGHKPRPG